MTAVLRDLIGLDRHDRSPDRARGHARGHTPLAERLTARLRDLIRAGRVPAGTKLPSGRVLARDLGLARNTVAVAIDQLAAEGYLTTARGRCPRVAAGAGGLGVDGLGVDGLGVDGLGVDNLRMDGLGAGGARRPPTPRAPEPGIGAGRAGPDSLPARPLRACLADGAAFPYDQWALCLRDAVRRGPRGAAENNRPALQEALCAHLAEFRGVRAEPRQVVVVPTAQAALSLVAFAHLDRGDRVWMEEPGYAGMRAALAAASAEIVPAPVDGHGLAIPPGPAPRLIFTTPSHHFPTGRLMPVGRRHELLAVAARHGTLIVEDDYDGEFHYDGAPVPALQGLDAAESVLYVGTFAKATTPDIRVGYLIVPRPLLATVAAAQRQWGLVVSPHVQDALGLFLRRGLYRAHIRRMRRLYRARRDHLVAALETRGADVFRVERPPGGLQLVAALDGARDDAALAAAAAARGIEVAPLSGCFLGPPTLRGLLIGFATWPVERHHGTVDALCALARGAV